MGEQKRREVRFEELQHAFNNAPDREAKNKIIELFTKEMIKRGKIVEAGWISLRAMSITPNAPQIQLDEMRMAFFAGAQHLFGSMMSILDPGDEPTEDDYARMDKIAKELDDFIKDFELKHIKVEGSA